MEASVIAALRRFLPAFKERHQTLPPHIAKALWAITHCRTATMGGHVYSCPGCEQSTFSYHSCNHRNCPQCGRESTSQWVEAQLQKRVASPYFMVTFTLPCELRGLFFGHRSKALYDALFAAASGSLKEKLAVPKWLGARKSGFTGILHTWDQRLRFHPHLHFIVPAAGIDASGEVVTVKSANFLVPVNVLRTSFRAHMRAQLEALGVSVEPTVWEKDWGVHIQGFGNGSAAIKYLGAYVCRTAIGDKRLLAIKDRSVEILWRDRADKGKTKRLELDGVEFVERYLLHVLPAGMRAVRYYGYCHPAARETFRRVALHTGAVVFIGPAMAASAEPRTPHHPQCKHCERAMILRGKVAPHWQQHPRPPPVPTSRQP